MKKIMSNDLIKDINKYLEDYFKDKGTYNKLVYEACSYSVNVGGKRIRPMLFMLTYNMYKKSYDNVIDIAAAIEMIHTYSLIHDDLPCMDNDDLRRGKPTNHKIFGENIAVLCGDALLNEAMIIMMKYCINKGGNSLRAAYEIAKASGAEGMIGGQIVDVINEGKKISKEELEYMHLKKTGALIKASIVSGAILSNAPKEDLEKLNAYGEKLGVIFQIRDDILDVISSTKVLGKKVHSDEQNNKTNFITTYGLEKCDNMCIELTNECINILESLTVDAQNLINLTNELLKREK